MARLDYRYGQAQWVDVHPGDIIPNYSGTGWITVTEDMINPDGVLKYSCFEFDDTISRINSIDPEEAGKKYPNEIGRNKTWDESLKEFLSKPLPKRTPDEDLPPYDQILRKINKK